MDGWGNEMLIGMESWVRCEDLGAHERVMTCLVIVG